MTNETAAKKIKASPVVCRVALVILEMNFQDSKEPPRQQWQVDEIRFCCEGVVEGGRPSMDEIEKGWRLARRPNVSPAALAERCKEGIS
jgi:hypothetical protein